MATSFDELIKRTTTKKTQAKAAHRAHELFGELLLSDGRLLSEQLKLNSVKLSMNSKTT